MQEQAGFVFGPFRLDVRDERLWRGPDCPALRHKTLGVLHALVARPGQLLTKEALFASVWPETAVSETVLTVAIRELRRVLGDQARRPQFIETVHGRGYRFIAPVTVVEPSPERSLTAGMGHQSQPDAFARPACFVGREGELAQLHQWFTMARQGMRQVVFITGAAGIGKTALVDAFVAQVRRHGAAVGGARAVSGAVWTGGTVSARIGSLGTPLPGRRGCALPGGGAAVCPELAGADAGAAVARRPGRAAADRQVGSPQPRMLRELTEALDRLTAEHPLVLVLEDLQWSDGATLEWLTYVARRRDAARLLLLGTYRPVDAMVRAHLVRTVMTELTQHQQGAELPLDALSADDVAAYGGQRLRVHPFPAALARALHQRSHGHPLFVVTLVDALLRQGLLHEGEGGRRRLHGRRGDHGGGAGELASDHRATVAPGQS